jgi:hypothetical protein
MKTIKIIFYIFSYFFFSYKYDNFNKSSIENDDELEFFDDELDDFIIKE